MYLKAKLVFCVLLAGAITLQVAGCASLIDPYVGVDKDTRKSVVANPTMEASVSYADDLREAYYDAISEQAILNTGVGLAVIPMAALALFFAATSASTDVIIGLGTAGAATYGAGTFLRSRPRQIIYAVGANGVNCALAAVRPLRVAGTQQAGIENLLIDVVPALDRAEAILGANRAVSTRELAELDAALATAKTESQRVQLAIPIVQNGGLALYDAVERIRGLVNRALIDTEPDLANLVSTLGTSLPVFAGQITGVTPARVSPKPAIVGEASLAGTTTMEVEELTTVLRMASRRFAGFADLVEQAPSEETLENCGVDVKTAGVTFTVSPSEIVEVSANQADATATIVVSRGVLPYEANWIGQSPSSANVTKTLTYGSAANGVVTLDVKKGAAAADYRLLLTDSGAGRRELLVRINAPSPGGATKAPQTAPATSGVTTRDPIVAEIQGLLIELGFDVPNDADKPGLRDGVWGEVTMNAFTRYVGACEQGASVEDFDVNDRTEIRDVLFAAKTAGSCQPPAN